MGSTGFWPLTLRVAPMSNLREYDSPAVTSSRGAEVGTGAADRLSIAETVSALKALATRLEANPESQADSWESPPALESFGVDVAALVAGGPARVRRFAAAWDMVGAVAVDDERGVRRALRRMAKAGTPVRLPSLVDAADFWTAPPPQMDWVLPGVLPAGEVALLVGADGAGKSLVALELVLAVASAVPWACQAPDPGQPWSEPWLLPATSTPGRVLYIGGEDDRDEYKRRFRQIAAVLGLPAPRPGQIAVMALDAEPLQLMRAGRQQASPEETPAVDALRDLIIRSRPRLIVVDPLIMFHALSEVDPQHMDSLMRLFIRLARSVPGCALLAVHHAGQDAVRGSTDDHMLGRGSTALSAAVRVVLTLRRGTAQETAALQDLGLDPKLWRRLRGPKISRGPEREGVWMAFHGGVPVAEDPPIAATQVAGSASSHPRRTATSSTPRVVGISDRTRRRRLEWVDGHGPEEMNPDDAE